MCLCCADDRRSSIETSDYRELLYNGVRMWFTPSTLIIVLVQLIVYCVQLVLDNDGAEHFWASRTYPYELWRYVTYGFIHASLAHIVANVSMTLILAPTLEFVQGSLVVAVTWVGGVVGGGLAHVLYNDGLAVVGSSAGVYALIVVRISDVIVNSRNMRTWTLRLLTLCCLALPGLVDWITTDSFTTTSHSAHIGGVIAGILVSLTCVRNISRYI